MRSTAHVAFDDAIDRGASNAQEVAELGSAVRAGAVRRDEMGSWRGLSFGGRPRRCPFGVGDAHSLLGVPNTSYVSRAFLRARACRAMLTKDPLHGTPVLPGRRRHGSNTGSALSSGARTARAPSLVQVVQSLHQ